MHSEKMKTRLLLSADLFLYPLAHSWVNVRCASPLMAQNGRSTRLLSLPITWHEGQSQKKTWLLPPNGRADGKVIHLDDKIANPRQRALSYPDQFGQVKAAPGDFVALQYQENGHVTKPSVAPSNR